VSIVGLLDLSGVPVNFLAPLTSTAITSSLGLGIVQHFKSNLEGFKTPEYNTRIYYIK
jgi:hypothetical protein